MKHSFKALALVAAIFAVSACSSSSDFDDTTFATPYTLERTATSTQKMAVKAPEPAPVAAPQCPACQPVQQCDYSAWEAKTSKLQADLASCRESSTRVRDAYREELVK